MELHPLMGSNVAAYQKLAKTPLSQKNHICGLSPCAMAIVLGIVSILVDVLPNVAVVVMLQGDLKPGDDDKTNPFFGKTEGKQGHKAQVALLVMTLLFPVLQFLCILCLIFGSCQNTNCCILLWLCMMPFNVFFGKFIPALFLVLSGVKYALMILILTVFDIPLTVLLVYCYGQMAAIERNERYMNVTPPTTYTASPNAPPPVHQGPPCYPTMPPV